MRRVRFILGRWSFRAVNMKTKASKAMVYASNAIRSVLAKLLLPAEVTTPSLSSRNLPPSWMVYGPSREAVQLRGWIVSGNR